MAIVGIVWFSGHLLTINAPDYVALYGPEPQGDLARCCYGLAFSIVALVQANKTLRI